MLLSSLNLGPRSSRNRHTSEPPKAKPRNPEPSIGSRANQRCNTADRVTLVRCLADDLEREHVGEAAVK